MVIFVTGNKGKVKEARSILDIDIKRKDIGYIEIQSESLYDIAEYGVAEAYNNLRRPCFVEDSGLFISNLDGFPGPYSSYVYKKLGNKGISKIMQNSNNRDAVFKSVISYHDSSSIKSFEGDTKGKITKKPRGNKGFGFDPIFEINGKTYAEMEKKDKNKISHRRKALEKFSDWYKKEIKK